MEISLERVFKLGDFLAEGLASEVPLPVADSLAGSLVLGMPDQH